MGMGGMTNEAAAAYAAADVKPEKRSAMTVAEFRNAVNPITGYYDWMNVDAFWADTSLSLKEKISVIFGNLVGNCIDEKKANELLAARAVKKEEQN